MAQIIALCPGQGSQRPKMALDYYQESGRVRDLFALSSDITGIDAYALLSEGTEEELTKTKAAQLAITLATRSAVIRLQELDVNFIAYCGFSLGELAAYGSAGIFDDETLFRIIKTRAALMDDQATQAQEKYGHLSMAAVIGLDYEQVSTTLKEEDLKGVYAANDNGPTQVVISGLENSIAQAKQLLLEKGARRVIPLKVSGPFHTPFMDGATESFRSFLADLRFNDPSLTVVSSVDGSIITTKEEARDHLAKQLAMPVRWMRVMQEVSMLAKQTGAQVAEVGYGTVLSSLCKNSALDLNCLTLTEEAALKAFAKEQHHE